MSILVVALAALVAGAVNAVAGGGTFLTFPALTGYCGLTEKVANMTSTVGLWPGSASAVAATTDDLARIPRAMLIAYSIISLLGGTAGAILLQVASTATFRLVIPWLLGFATLIFGFSKPISRWAGRQHGRRSLPWTIFVGFVQLAVAVYGGYFGAGIGVLMLAGLAFAGLDSIHQMNALKVLQSTLINLVASLIFLFGSQLHRLLGIANAEPINWHIAAAMAVASTVGGFVGMTGGRRVKPDQLRFVILAIGVSLTGFYFWKSYHG